MAIEEPKFSIIESSEQFELRAYEPKIVAETFVSGSAYDASRTGFKRIANYIFGNNTSASGSNEKISMTAPVTIEQQSENVAMTAPVTLEEQDDMWRVHFVMPAGYTMETLPTPNSKSVTLREIPASNYAVISFSGLSGEKKVVRKTNELLSWLESKNITPTGKPELARYNTPWTPPFMRRNEVMVSY